MVRSPTGFIMSRYPEIGGRLHVSRHTVKTQAVTVYRKFGMPSRSEAIQRAHDVGLLGR